MTGRGRDTLLADLLGELSEADKARFVRGITLGALAGAALAGSVLRARRARRRPRPVLRVEGPGGQHPGSASVVGSAGDPGSPDERGTATAGEPGAEVERSPG